MSEKIQVNGDDPHELYKYLKANAQKKVDKIEWNFCKFLIDVANDKIVYHSKATNPMDL